jgi:hypothetical protein
MFDELSKYKQSDHFFFRATDNLDQVCNAPTDKSGVYVIYALKGGRIELVYIGRSGEVNSDGIPVVSNTDFGGLKDELLNGSQFGGPRRSTWKTVMQYEKIEALDVYWYVTYNDKFVDCPKTIQGKLLQKHVDIYGRLPKWNSEL